MKIDLDILDFEYILLKGIKYDNLFRKIDMVIPAGNTMKKKICAGIMSEDDCYKMQLHFQDYILQENILDIADILYVAGVDLAYWQEKGEEFAVCCIAIIDYKNNKVVERVNVRGKIKFPYIAGYLAFRELPLVFKAVEKLKIQPDVYMFDGNGILHPRMMGIATQASFFLKRPTLGVAKSYYKIENAEFEMPEDSSGSYRDIVIDKKVMGRVLRTHDNVKPVFVSVGNYIDLESATKIVLKMVGKESHIPIPTRIADMDTHKMRELYKNK